jgi:hypothetical protein
MFIIKIVFVIVTKVQKSITAGFRVLTNDRRLTEMTDCASTILVSQICFSRYLAICADSLVRSCAAHRVQPNYSLRPNPANINASRDAICTMQQTTQIHVKVVLRLLLQVQNIKFFFSAFVCIYNNVQRS